MIQITAPLLVEVGEDHFINLSLAVQVRPDRDALRVEYAVPLPAPQAHCLGAVLHYELLEGVEADRLRAFLRTHRG
ncbi:MAG: hypothetical protein H0T73_09795 [Ardenticatenales bacterium]|nr:hypothetical protein [Ardenticatenales bacterium]